MINFKKVGISNWSTVTILVFVFIASFIGVYGIYETKQLQECQAVYNQITNERTLALNETGEKERNARRQVIFAEGAMWDAYADGKPREEIFANEFMQLLTSIDKYEKAWLELEKELTEHPIPPPPNETCG